MLKHFREAFQSPEVAATLAYLELDEDDADAMFSMFDVDEVGVVNHGEVVDGFLRFRGNARAKHLLECHCDFDRLADDVNYAKVFSRSLYTKSAASLRRQMENHLSAWYWTAVEAIDPELLRPSDFPMAQLESHILELAVDFPVVQDELSGMGLVPDLEKSMAPHMLGRNLDSLLSIPERLEGFSQSAKKELKSGPPTELPRAHPDLANPTSPSAISENLCFF